jgi:2-hydroxy-6-oxonona-2,4-dienedioate hydrolase
VTGARAAAATAHRVVVDGLEMQYDAAGSGPPVILVHGSGPGTSAGSTFEAIFEPLARRFRVLAPDMPGWSESAAVEYDARVQLGALVGFMDATGIERAAVVGHSLGGARALDLAAAHPDRVSRLVLLAAPAPGSDVFASSPSEGGKAVFDAYLEPSVERMAVLVANLFHDQSLATPELARRLSQAASAHPEHCVNFLAAVAASRFSIFAADDPASEIAGIVALTLIVHGRDDRVVSYEAALRLVSSIADSRALLLNRCGHWPHAERAGEVTAAIASFVQELPTEHKETP